MSKGKPWVPGGTIVAAVRVEFKVILAELRQLILPAWAPGNSRRTCLWLGLFEDSRRQLYNIENWSSYCKV